jgi:hypothetical protein
MYGLITYVVIVGGLFIALWKHPAVALAGVLCMFALEQWGQATTPFFAQHQTVTNLIMGTLLLLAVVVQLSRRGFAILAEYPPVGWLTMGLFAYAFLSVQWAPQPDFSMSLWSSRWPFVVTFIVLGPLVLADRSDLHTVYKSHVLVGGTLTLLLLLFVEWDGRRIVLEQDLGNPLAPAIMAGLVALFIILGNPWSGSRIMFVVRWVTVLVCLALIVRSGSRGQLIGVFGVAAVCWSVSRGGSIKQLSLFFVCALCLGSATSWAIEEFWTRPGYVEHAERWTEDSAQEDMADRIHNALHLLELWISSPDKVIIGLGNSASYDHRILGFYPHLVPLEVLAEEGLIGMSLYMLILVFTIRSAIRCYYALENDRLERLPFGALLGGYLFLYLLSLKQGSLLLNLEPFMFGIVLGWYERQLFTATSFSNEDENRTGPIQEGDILRLGRHPFTGIPSTIAGGEGRTISGAMLAHGRFADK